LRFHGDALIALAGAAMPATLDGAAVPMGRAVPVRAGQVLAVGAARGPGQRAYLAVRNGFDVPRVLGSGATFALGGFGGHATGCLRTGDVLRIAAAGAVAPPAEAARAAPPMTDDWTLSVLYGPHGAPDFFDPADLADLFSASYQVHYNSARTGVRLIGPTPRWARPDGGEAGLHPSNIHDNAYAVGAIDFTGNLPILLGPDGPSLGGFVCPAVVSDADRWKLGQLRPGDRVHFVRAAPGDDDPVLLRLDLDERVLVRRQGERNILVEFGAPVLDIGLRLRAQILLDALRAEDAAGIVDLTPGIRSLQIHYDPAILPLPRLLDRVAALLRAAPPPESIRMESRLVHLPLSWDDEQARLAATRYMEVVRPDAPWCPSNLEFIRRINGLGTIEEVADIVFAAEYLVLGLGDVYLGAPVATPVDPQHRLVTTKYNPARTWTPENAVGIGGAYLCVYGMEGPGGYQLVGRTVQMWNTWRRTAAFERPYLLRFFDRIRFHRVSGAELAEARAAFPHGRYDVRIEPGQFDLAALRALEAREAAGITATRARQQAAFARERASWAERGLDSFPEPEPAAEVVAGAVPEGCASIDTPVPGNLWKVQVAVGDTVRAGETLAIVESMKAEMRLIAPQAGVVRAIPIRPGRDVAAGQRIVLIEVSS
jgi:urea carboxylase